jgi:hypothetical protein
MSFRLSAPSKTFLAGEYAVLSGGPALLLCTSPRFQLHVAAGVGRCLGISEGTPAARWLEERRPLLVNYDLEFRDPHDGRGGFGASGAQFLLVHALTTFLQGGFSQIVKGVDRGDLWNDLNVLSNGSGSGADVLALSAGVVARVDVAAREANSLAWPYPDLSFAIVRTREKVPTHEHLAVLDKSRIRDLAPAAFAVTEAFGTAPARTFLEKLRRFALGLRDLGLQTGVCLNMLRLLEEQDWCLAAKGCGAMGADTVLFLYSATEESSVQRFLIAQGWRKEAGVKNLSRGLSMEWSENLEN